MVTARSEDAERVRGLSVGADDYVVKPFSVPELMARVHALLRRSRPERIADRLNAGDLGLDRETGRVRRGESDIHLSPTLFRLLELLMEKPGRVFSRAQLLDGVWGQYAEIDDRTVDVHVGRLRKALSKGRERDPHSSQCRLRLRREIWQAKGATFCDAPQLKRSSSGLLSCHRRQSGSSGDHRMVGYPQLLHRRDLQRPLNVDSSRPLCAKSSRSRALIVWSRRLLVHSYRVIRGMRYGPGSTWERHDDRGGPSSDTA